MSLIKKILLPLFSIFILVLLFVNRMVPTGDLWKGYSLLYVPVDTPDDIVMDSFEKNNVLEVVSLKKQEKYLPIDLNSDSPEAALSFISSNDKNSAEYLSRRTNYFYDKSREFRIYYIPSKYKNNIKGCISYLSKNHINAGIDSKAVYPVVLPILCVLLFAVLFYFARNKLLFAGISLFPLFYIFTNPFYPSGICTTLCLLLIFCCTNLWKREGAVEILKRNYILMSVGLTALLSAFSSSLLSGLYFVLAVFGAAAFIFFYDEMEEYFLNKKAFRFVYIRPAKMISIFAGRTKAVVSLILLTQILILAAFFATSTRAVSSHFSKVLLPSANVMSFERDDNLPVLDEYYKWTWKIFTYPYISLNKSSDANENEVVFPRYHEINGLIEREETHIFYNMDFISEVKDNIDKLPYESIESVLKKQTSSLNPGYSSVKSNPVNIFGIIMMIVSVFLLLFIYFSVIIRSTKSGGKK